MTNDNKSDKNIMTFCRKIEYLLCDATCKCGFLRYMKGCDNVEILDLYDEQRNLTGETIYRGEKVPDNRYIFITVIFIQNNKGEFLIQKTSKEKGGYYSSTGGHLNTGETTLDCIIREVNEEIGLDLSTLKDKLVLFKFLTVIKLIYFLLI